MVNPKQIPIVNFPSMPKVYKNLRVNTTIPNGKRGELEELDNWIERHLKDGVLDFDSYKNI